MKVLFSHLLISSTVLVLAIAAEAATDPRHAIDISPAKAFAINDLNLGSVPVIYLGEFHPDVLSKFFLVKNMPVLKTEGVDCLGLEMFRTIDQPLLNDFAEDKTNAVMISHFLDDEWGWLGMSQLYAGVVAAAKASHVKVVGLDGRHLYETGVRPQGARDQHMAKAISQAFQDKTCKKMVVLIGAMHISARPQYYEEPDDDTDGVVFQPQILKDTYGIDSRRYLIVPLVPDYEDNRLREAAKAGPLGLDSTFVSVADPVDGENGFLFIDGILKDFIVDKKP